MGKTSLFRDICTFPECVERQIPFRPTTSQICFYDAACLHEGISITTAATSLTYQPLLRARSKMQGCSAQCSQLEGLHSFLFTLWLIDAVSHIVYSHMGGQCRRRIYGRFASKCFVTSKTPAIARKPVKLCPDRPNTYARCSQGPIAL